MRQTLMKDLRGDALAATDGTIGSVKDVYFDDERWAVRYLVVDTGGWLTGRKVLISPASLDPARGDDKAIGTRLTREEVANAPDIDEDMPVSRQYEKAHAEYFRYPYYWTGPYLWGLAPVPTPAILAQPAPEDGDEARAAEARLREAEQKAAESHLRSGAEVVGYRIRATDGPLGHVEDLVVDDESWAIDRLVVDTTDWLPGGHVMVEPGAVDGIDHASREVRLRLSRDEIRRRRPA